MERPTGGAKRETWIEYADHLEAEVAETEKALAADAASVHAAVATIAKLRARVAELEAALAAHVDGTLVRQLRRRVHGLTRG